MKKWLIILLALMIIVSGCKLIGKLESVGCSVLPQGKTKEHCFQDAAVRMSNPATCEKILGTEWSEGDGNPRKNKCYRRIAVKTSNANLCEKLEYGRFAETKEDCYTSVAISTLNAGICSAIENEYIKQDCVNKVSSQPLPCTDFDCVVDFGIENKNILVCEKTQNTANCMIKVIHGFEANVRDMVVHDIPTIFEVLPQCEHFNDPVYDYSCSFIIAQMYGNKEVCTHILEPKYNKICKMFTMFQKPPFDLNKKTGRNELKEVCDSMEGEWLAMCKFMYASALVNLWDDREEEDFAVSAEVKKDAFSGLMDFCTDFDKIEEYLSRFHFFHYCVLKSFEFSQPEYCEDLSGDQKQLCLTYAGQCTDPDFASLCNDMVKPTLAKVDTCSNNDCKEEVKKEAAIKYLKEEGVDNINPFEALFKQSQEVIS